MSARTRSSSASSSPVSSRSSSPRRARWPRSYGPVGPAYRRSSLRQASAPRSPTAACRGDAPDGSIAKASPPKETREMEWHGKTLTFVLENAIATDFALVRAWKGDRHGNLVFRQSARNFNPLAAMAGRITIAEVEHLVDPGEIDADAVHLPGIYVQRVLPLTAEQAADKRIERRTVQPKPDALNGGHH